MDISAIADEEVLEQKYNEVVQYKSKQTTYTNKSRSVA